MQCPRCQNDNLELAIRCALCGASLIRSSLPPVAAEEELAVAERREATVLFADLLGYTEFAQNADVEEVASVMNAIKQAAIEIVRTYGGVVNQFVGDEIMAVFGLPYGHEDDPRRAVSAALELHAFVQSPRVARLLRGHQSLRLHTGITSGLVLAHSHDLRDGVFHLTGSTVNLAARLRAEAGADEILISEATHALVAPFFCTAPLPARKLKGIFEPVAPYRVQAPGAVRSSFELALERGLTPYVGRRSELATLEQYLADANRGEGRLVSLVGAPGVGKTRLVHELSRRAAEHGFVVLRGQCQSYGNIPPFQPFLETLADAVELADPSQEGAANHVVERVRALDPALASHLPVYLYLLGLNHPAHPLPVELRGQSLRRAVIHALGQILTAHARRHPLLVIVEDWHWADEASDALYRDLARATEGQPIMGLLTYRSEQLSDNRRPLSHRHLNLGHFHEAGTTGLLCELLHSEELPAGLAAHVHAATDGNPFFIEELAHALVDSGVLKQVGPRWILTRPIGELVAPENVQAMVRARVDRLARPDKELLKLASVIGSEFSIELLRALSESAHELPPVLTRLERRAHIRQLDPLVYRFKHPIVHDVVYNVLLLQRRRELHGSIARLIEGQHQARGLEPHYEALAHHYGRSDDRERAVLYAELAGRKAERSFSLDQARSHYAQAIEALDELPLTPERMRQRVDLSLQWTSVLVHNSAPGQLTILQRSLEYATRIGYTRGLARLLSWTGWVEYTLGNLDSAIAHNQRCLQMRDQLDDPRPVQQAEANIGMSYIMAGRYAEAEPFMAPVERSVVAGAEAFAAEDSSAAASRGYALGHIALLAADRGEFARALELLEHAERALIASGRYALLGALATIEGIVHAFRGDFVAAGRAAGRVREVAERIDGAYQRHMASALESLYLVYELGDRRGVEQLRGAALALESRGVALALSWTFATLAELLLFVGQPEEARIHADSALARASVGDGLGQASALRARAQARHRTGDLAGAGADFEAALAVAACRGSPREEALIRLAQAECKARPLDAGLRSRFEAMSMPWYAARA